jgi:hypothetical protein
MSTTVLITLGLSVRGEGEISSQSCPDITDKAWIKPDVIRGENFITAN